MKEKSLHLHVVKGYHSINHTIIDVLGRTRNLYYKELSLP